MFITHTTAVEITTGDDHVDIWVDANNNGVRDDDDVEIYITRNGSFYVDSLHLKSPLDEALKEKLRESALKLIEAQAFNADNEESHLSNLALALVQKALIPSAEQPVLATPQPLAPAVTAAPQAPERPLTEAEKISQRIFRITTIPEGLVPMENAPSA